MTEAGKQFEGKATDHPAQDPARLRDLSEVIALNPLFAQSAATMAAAATIGFSLANQMAGMFFGALQGVMEATNPQKVPNSPPETESAAGTGSATAPADVPELKKDLSAPEPLAVAVKPKPKLRKSGAEAVISGATAVGTAAAAKPAAVLPRQRRTAKPGSSRKVAAAAAEGDLKRISGIGPKLEARLKALGVAGLADIAGWRDADVSRFDAELGLEGRIKRDDWVGQAKALLN